MDKYVKKLVRSLWVACITDKVWEARLRWFGHVQRREEEDCVRRILEADVHGQRSRGRQRKRWIDVVKCNMEDLRLDLMNVENRAEWRRRTRVADPHPRDFQPEGDRERANLLASNEKGRATYVRTTYDDVSRRRPTRSRILTCSRRLPRQVLLTSPLRHHLSLPSLPTLY